jgi:methylenetetrahydrofolate dehydrogenase (NADP+) / methenyltetrahydrofolate cyclohydrolase
MILLDGKATSNQIKAEIAIEVQELTKKGIKAPHLAAILVGSNGASLTYVNAKVKACAKAGFESTLVTLPQDISEKDLLNEIDKLNTNPQIDGFIVQLPLPKHIDEQKVLMAVNPEKDVDGFHPTNVGKMALNLPTCYPIRNFRIIGKIPSRNNRKACCCYWQKSYRWKSNEYFNGSKKTCRKCYCNHYT